ncbi:MAG TPA: GNAT family N-acetyltransferase [Burkholderiaceae bacterium]|nr:GNAT family N-acetyltransferase [Burkholderiaceae bacterium]
MFDPRGLPASLRSTADAVGARLEDAGLTSSQPPQQTIYDGWLLRYSPGKAKRARSVNAIGAGRLPLERKLAEVEAFYRRVVLPCLYRLTPFSEPSSLDHALDCAGYIALDESRVMALELGAGTPVTAPPVTPIAVDVVEFARVAGALRGSPPGVVAAETERLAHAALPACYLVVREGAQSVACGSIVIDAECAGVFNMVTASERRGRGYATVIVQALLAHAAAAGAHLAYLQVDAANAPARRIYERFGFRDRYAYWYRAAPASEGRTS